MRIISGRLKGRKLKSVRGARTRPTADRVRESLFNILGPESVRDAVVLDLFAGTGALGIEALSRGAARAVFVEKAQPAVTVLKSNLAACELTQTARVIQWDILKNLNCLKHCEKPFTLVFLDPPYDRGMVKTTLRHLVASRSLARKATIVIEHDPAEVAENIHPRLVLADRRRYGKTSLSFLTCQNGNEDANDCIDTDSMLE